MNRREIRLQRQRCCQWVIGPHQHTQGLAAQWDVLNAVVDGLWYIDSQ